MLLVHVLMCVFRLPNTGAVLHFPNNMFNTQSYIDQYVCEGIHMTTRKNYKCINIESTYHTIRANMMINLQLTRPQNK